MKMKKLKTKMIYYSLDDILKTDSEYNIIVGERSNGKSYAVKRYAIFRALENPNQKFMYLRRYSDDVSKSTVTSYLSDMKDELYKVTKKYNNLFARNGRIYAEELDENDKQIDVVHIGYYKAVSEAERMKSTSYLDVDTIIFEEFIASKFYLKNEIDLFESIISTVARRRRIKVFMIANTVSRNNIYYNHFSLTKALKQKMGTIDIYKLSTDPPQYDEITGEQIVVKIAVERCDNLSNNTKMIAGRNQKSITSGEWASEIQPRTIIIESDELLYTIVFEYGLLKYVAGFYRDKDCNYFWYIEPKTTNIQNNTRVISDKITRNRLYTSNLVPLYAAEEFMFKYLTNGKVFYSDNLTGTEFKQALKYFKYNII